MSEISAGLVLVEHNVWWETDGGSVKVFDGNVYVDYGFVEVCGTAQLADVRVGTANRQSGLLGWAHESSAFVFTASGSGLIPFEVHYVDREPSSSLQWEVDAQVSLLFPDGRFGLSSFDHLVEFAIPFVGLHGVRCSARGMSVAREMGSRWDNQPETDRYRLDVWPVRGSREVGGGPALVAQT